MKAWVALRSAASVRNAVLAVTVSASTASHSDVPVQTVAETASVMGRIVQRRPARALTARTAVSCEYICTVVRPLIYVTIGCVGPSCTDGGSEVGGGDDAVGLTGNVAEDLTLARC